MIQVFEKRFYGRRRMYLVSEAHKKAFQKLTKRSTLGEKDVINLTTLGVEFETVATPDNQTNQIKQTK